MGTRCQAAEREEPARTSLGLRPRPLPFPQGPSRDHSEPTVTCPHILKKTRPLRGGQKHSPPDTPSQAASRCARPHRPPRALLKSDTLNHPLQLFLLPAPQKKEKRGQEQPCPPNPENQARTWAPSAYPEHLIQCLFFVCFSVSLLPGKPLCGKQVKRNLLFHLFKGTESVMCVLFIHIYMPYISVCLNICINKYIYLCVYTYICSHICYLAYPEAI